MEDTRLAPRSKPTRRPQIDLVTLFAPEIRAWRGEATLSTVFWFHGVLTSLVLTVFFAVSIYQGEVLTEQGLLIGLSLYTAWVLFSIWRCALSADPFWGSLARALTIFWAANSALVLLFMQLGLIVHYFGK